MANRRFHNVTANTVDVVRVYVAQFFHAGPRQLSWDGASPQARASMSTVITKKGQVSTCNAGAEPSPAEEPHSRSSRSGTTHHHGCGNSPLSRLTKGFSMWSKFIVLLKLAAECHPERREGSAKVMPGRFFVGLRRSSE